MDIIKYLESKNEEYKKKGLIPTLDLLIEDAKAELLDSHDCKLSEEDGCVCSEQAQ